jgi:hypothetical protein
MDRSALIERLIADQIGKLGIEPGSRRFLQCVEREFRGFGRMSDAGLEAEFVRRGLEFDEAPEPVDYEDEENEDDEETSWLLRDMRAGDEDRLPGQG